jgi:DNA-binding MarR family transcriptional regulator
MGFKTKDAAEPEHISQVHEFNWFYAEQIELLQEPLRRSPYAWTELRILYQLLHGNVCTASELGELLDVDPGYLSRILKRFESLNLIDRARSPADGRELLERLTSKARRVCVPLEKQASANVKRFLERVGYRAALFGKERNAGSAIPLVRTQLKTTGRSEFPGTPQASRSL